MKQTMTKRPLYLLGGCIEPHVAAGGGLRYELDDHPEIGQEVWFVFGTFPDQSEQPVFTSTSGQHKHFKSADAVIHYHRRMCPRDTTVPLSVNPLRARRGQ